MTFLEDMLQHARDEAPREACGLVVSRNGRPCLVRAKNIADDSVKAFDLDPDAWLEVPDNEAVIGIYHSHPQGRAQPSMADLTGCEASGLPWHIVNLEGNYTCTQPSGFKAPYEGRPYVHGVHDCYSIIRDWYEWEWDIELPDFERTEEWWEKGANLYVENFAEAGFRAVRDEPPQVGDVLLSQIRSTVPNHAVLYVGPGTILHHVQGRLSTKASFDGAVQRYCTHHLRHESNG